MVHIDLANSILDIRQRIMETVGRRLIDEIDKNAFCFVDQRLQEMEAECRLGDLRPIDQRWPELARIAEETDPRLMSPTLGGELIEIEKRYQCAM